MRTVVAMSARVLVVTGGLFSVTEASMVAAASKQLAVLQAAEGGWLDVHLKVLGVERILRLRQALGASALRRAPWGDTVRRAFNAEALPEPPELTEVLLTTLLHAEGVPFDVVTWSELHADAALRVRLLDRCDVVLASTTLLRSLSELASLVNLVKRPDNRVVVGGALVSILHAEWPGVPGVDLVAVGYGEHLVPSLAHWIRSGFNALLPPEGGRLEQRADTPILYGGLPAGLNLDHLPAPDWRLAQRTHGRSFPLATYESVRGCPYRCAFCNYPFLFDDTRFRTLSAERIADDWLRMAAHGVRRIRCLDSLFTMPRRRLLDLCERLIAQGSPVEWICYARADDLQHVDVVRQMKRAGCVQVQIGLESGSQQQLDNMNKRCTVEANHRALRVCRDEGVTSFATFIVGFPGETRGTLDETLEFLRRCGPDFAFAAVFSTKFVHTPVLQPEARARFGLRTHYDGHDTFPPWQHNTMNSLQACAHMREFNRVMMSEGLALEAGMFFPVVERYRHEDRSELLAFQRTLVRSRPLLAGGMGALRSLSLRRATQDHHRLLGAPE